MRALIFTGGEGPAPSFARRLADAADLVIAADSGLVAAMAAGVLPDLAVGDFDSLPDRGALAAMPEGSVLEYPADKDDTDTELALRVAAERGADWIAVAGGGGGRLDHLLGVFSLFARRSGFAPREWHTGEESAYAIAAGETARFAALPGDIVSVFPAGLEGSSGMTSEGLKWPLKGLVWDRGYFGISNLATGNGISISAGTSGLVIILPGGRERIL
ncbi:thiamine diphosphokinase [bacterium]|nr:thiamine diphosphokinase [bacterium]